MQYTVIATWRCQVFGLELWLVSPPNTYHSETYCLKICLESYAKARWRTGQRHAILSRVQKFTNTLRLHFNSSMSFTIILTTLTWISLDPYHCRMVSYLLTIVGRFSCWPGAIPLNDTPAPPSTHISPDHPFWNSYGYDIRQGSPIYFTAVDTHCQVVTN